MYETINEELKIKACELGDLTAEQVSHFLGQWEEGAKIGTLTLFFEKENGDLVLNKSNENYDTYRELAELYMGGDFRTRDMMHKEMPVPGMKETLNVMEECLKSRKIEERIFWARENAIESKMAYKLLSEIVRRYSPHTVALLAYKCGIICGKRIERKKKRQSVNAHLKGVKDA